MNLESIKSTVTDQVIDINTEMINKLYVILKETFEDECVAEHIEKLTDHVKTFYDEVISEISTRHYQIKDEIAELYQEESNLRRLLNVDIRVSPQKIDVPLYTLRMKIDDSLTCLRNKLKQRHDDIRHYLVRETAICEELDEVPRGITTDPLPSESDLIEFDEYLMDLSREKIKRETEIIEYRMKIRESLQCLQLNMDRVEDYDILHSETVRPTKKNVLYLKKMVQHFDDKFEELKRHIKNMKDKLIPLWNYLGEDADKIQKFMRYTEYNQSVCDLFYQELDRCETIKRNNIEHFLERTRAEIKCMWDKCLKSQTERNAFKIMKSDTYTEDLLHLHELELQDLKQFYEDHISIFTLFEKRKGLFERMQTLEQKAKDPNRYTNRGGQLLKEEKERKEISSSLPVIENQLLELSKKFEESGGKSFTVFGEAIETLIQNEWNAIRAQKEVMSSARKTARDNTPVSKLCVTRTPRTNETRSTIRKLGMNSASSSIIRKKVATPSTVDVRRCLLKDLNSPRFVKPNSISTNKSPLKVYNGPSGVKRRSRVKSRTSINKKRKSKGGRAVPVINVIDTTDTNSGTPSDSASYDSFQDYLDTNEPSRSSMMPSALSKGRPKTVTAAKLPSTPVPHKNVLTVPRATTAPSAPMTTRNITLSNRTRSPSPGSTNRKLTTKNLPIMF